MPTSADRHAAQIAAWNGPMGEQWAATEQRAERSLAPVLVALMQTADVQPGERVIDIGCGGGGTTLALAEAVGPAGHVTGLDVSEPILAVARARLAGQAHVALIKADAAEFAAATPANLLFSRFGVMFFGDPVAVFRNLRRSLAPAGRLVFASWAPIPDNPWLAVPIAAVRPLLPPAPPADPEEPGQFAFADPDRMRRILTAAGFTPPAIVPHGFTMRFPADDLARTADGMANLGSLGRMLRDQPAVTRAAAVQAIQTAITPYVQDGFVVLGATVWLVTAQG